MTLKDTLERKGASGGSSRGCFGSRGPRGSCHAQGKVLNCKGLSERLQFCIGRLTQSCITRSFILEEQWESKLSFKLYHGRKISLQFFICLFLHTIACDMTRHAVVQSHLTQSCWLEMSSSLAQSQPSHPSSCCWISGEDALVFPIRFCDLGLCAGGDDFPSIRQKVTFLLLT